MKCWSRLGLLVLTLASMLAVTSAADAAPVISMIVGSPSDNGSAVITWSTDVPSSSSVSYGTSPGALNLQVSDSSLTTTHLLNLSGLATETTYYYQVTSADAIGNSATAPTNPASFVTPLGSLSDTTQGDLALGSGSCTVGSVATGAAVILTPTLGAEFDGNTLPPGWVSNLWSPEGTITVANGTVTLDAADIATTQTFTPGTSVEFVATFSGQPFQHVGLAADLQFNEPWIIFSTGASGGTLYARIAGQIDVEIQPPSSGTWLGAPHRFRIDWTTDGVVFSIEGATAVSIQTPGIPSSGLVLVASDFNSGGGILSVDWIRASPYVTPCAFTSRVLDAGGPVSWRNMSWNAEVPNSTSVALSYRIGSSASPDGSWSAFQPVSSSGSSVSGSSRYLQYRADMTSADSAQTPQLHDVIITYSSISVGAPPSIATQPVGTTILSGQTTTLGVVATGTAPLTYQWFSGLSGDTSTPIGAATTSTFTTPALTQTSFYWVRVSNIAGSINSNSAAVVVLQPPIITSQPVDQSVGSSQTATLSVNATGTAPLSYQWYVGTSGDSSNPVSNATGSTFDTPPLTQTTSYWVRVTNAAGAVDSSTATVTVTTSTGQNVPAVPMWGVALLAGLVLIGAARAAKR
jgi:hypothetical protein